VETRFETLNGVQRIYAPDGTMVAASVWTEDGPAPAAVAQSVGLSQVVREAVPAIIAGAAALYSWLSQNNVVGQIPVLGMRARDYVRPGEHLGHVEYVGTRTREEVEACCRRYADVQRWATQAAIDADTAGMNAAQRGTAIHKALADRVKAEGHPSLKAEVSVLKSGDDGGVRYGRANSVRFDIYENRGDGTVCVYDLKTGSRGLSAARFAELAATATRLFPGIRRIIVVEVRPNK
jgi:hypothetical protein